MSTADRERGGSIQYDIIGMDCADCAGEIERAVAAVQGVAAVRVSIASQLMNVAVENPATALPVVELAVESLGYKLTRSKQGAAGGPLREPVHLSTSYRRALVLVIVLNLGYGVIEMVGGFLAGSQALKADALDFIGDGIITLLGLLAVRWSLRWRARSALVQGLFLGVLGTAVFVSTLYRLFAQQFPTAELMGGLGVIALVINLASAWVLIPHRNGDANVRAVWLFSRNDAIGNAAVVVAAGVVAWTKSPWPDLLTAMLMAGLFLHSAWSIIGASRADLRELSS